MFFAIVPEGNSKHCVRRNKKTWCKILNQYEASVSLIKDFAREQGISYTALVNWKYKLTNSNSVQKSGLCEIVK